MIARALLPFFVAATAFVAPDARVVDARVQQSPTLALPARLVAVTEPFVGAPYVRSPLGEGFGVDPDPRLRLDAFDCTTFVETAIALALSPDLDAARALLDRIRYRGGVPDFANRRHFPAAEWIPELVAEGFLVDITRATAGEETMVATKTLDRDAWVRRKKRILDELPLDRIPFGVHRIDVWPLALARQGVARIPPGTVLSVVRDDFRSTPVRVSHQGLVIEKDGALFLRHAADRLYHRVVDEPLPDFLARIARYGKWPVTGIHLARVTRPGAPATTAAP